MTLTAHHLLNWFQDSNTTHLERLLSVNMSLWEVAGWFSNIMLGLAGMVGTIYGIYAYFRGELGQLDPAYRAKAREALVDHNWLNSYQSCLSVALRVLNSLMGQPGSFKAFCVCLFLTVAYSPIFCIFAWGFGGQSRLGTIQLMPNWPALIRHTACFSFLVVALLIFLLVFKNELIDSSIKNWLAEILRRRCGKNSRKSARFIYHKVGSLLILLAFSISLYLLYIPSYEHLFLIISSLLIFPVFLSISEGYISVAFTYVLTILCCIAGADFVVLILIFALAFALAAVLKFPEVAYYILSPIPGVISFVMIGGFIFGADHQLRDIWGVAVMLILFACFIKLTVGTIAFAAVLPITLTIFVFIYSSDPLSTHNIGLVLFLVGLPLINALLDWASWWISRWLGLDLRRRLGSRLNRSWQFIAIAAHVVIDMAAALAFLWMLALVLPLVIELFNHWALATNGRKPLPLTDFSRQRCR